MKDSLKVVINQDLLNICYPFYYIRTILCVRDYNINFKSVQKVSFKNIFCTISANCYMLYLFVSTLKYTSFSMRQYMFTYSLMYSEFILYFCVVSVMNLYNSASSVRLLSVLHEINRRLYCRRDSKKFKLVAIASVCFIVLTSITFFIFKLFFDVHWSWMRALLVTVTLCLDIEIAYLVLFIYILTCKTEQWNDAAENINRRNENGDVTIDIDTNLEDMFHALNLLIEAWNLMAETSGLKVMLHFVTTFLLTLVYVTVMTFWLNGIFYTHGLAISHTVGISIMIPKMIMAEMALSWSCEAFYSEVTRAKSIVILKLSQDLTLKRKWINIQRVLDTDIQEMIATGGFLVDAALMVQFIRTVTAYTVVLLQFAFLQ